MCIRDRAYVSSLDLESQPLADPGTRKEDLAMLSGVRPQLRGRILAVVTSTARAGDMVAAGFEITELSRAYYTFRANGFEVDLASPRGGRPPVDVYKRQQ